MKKMIIVRLIIMLVMVAFSVEVGAQDIRLPQKPRRAAYHDYSMDDAGFWCAVEGNVGSSLILNHKNTQRGGATFTGGYRLNEFLRFGVGLGVNYYFAGNEDVRTRQSGLTMPVFANVRGNIISHEDREMVPYWSVNVGGSIGDGAFFSPTIGMRFGQPRSAFLLGLNYTLAEVKVRTPDYSKNVNFFALTLGYEF